LYGRVNNIPSNRLFTREQFDRHSADLQDRRVISLDDEFYSGQQARSAMTEVNANRRALAGIGSYEYFARSMNSSKSSVEFIIGQTDLSLNVHNGRVTSRYSAEDKAVLTTLNGPSTTHDPGISGLFSTIVFPHMTSDTTPRWLARFGHTFWKSGHPAMESVWDELAPPVPTASSVSKSFSGASDKYPYPPSMHSKGLILSDFHIPLGDFGGSMSDYHSPSLDLHDSMFWPTFHDSYKSFASLHKKNMSMLFDALIEPKFKPNKKMYSGDFLHLLEGWHSEFKKPWEIVDWDNGKILGKNQTPLELAMSKSSKYIFGAKDNTASSDFFGAKPTARQQLLSETAKGAITLDPTTGAKQSNNQAKVENIYLFNNGKMSSLGSINPYFSDFETNSFSQSVKAAVLQHQNDSGNKPKEKAWMSPYDVGAKSGKPPKTLAKQLHYAH
jgi:hypothetical protein